MNKYQSLSDQDLNVLAIQFDVTAENIDDIISEVEVFMHIDSDNDWQRIIVVNDKAKHHFSFEQEQQAIDCLQQYLTEQQCVALELDCRSKNSFSAQSSKAY